MTQQCRPHRLGLTAFSRTLRTLCALAPLWLFGAGCSEEFLECVEAWQECKEDCPTLEEEAAIEAAALAARTDCLNHCPPLPQGGPCIKRCLEEYDTATALVGCNAECDAALNECVEAITPDSGPSGLARQVGPGTYEVDRVVLAGLISSPLGVLHGSTVAPVSIDGGMGFVLVAAEPGSPLRQLGAKPGDVLMRIGGQPVSNASWRAGMNQLLASGQARATLLRGGAQLNVTYRLR